MSVSNLKPSDSTKVQLLTDAQSDLLTQKTQTHG